MTDTPPLRVAAAQLEPVLLDRTATTERILTWIRRAADEGCRLVAFGEAVLPGYPVWLSLTGGARFDDALQKQLHARYLEQAVRVERGDLDPVRKAARDGGLWVALGTVECAADRGGHSLYCTLFTIDDKGRIRSAHRKLMPTYEERLSWAPGDGEGLEVHELDGFRVGALNCWENWLPLARATLHAQGENLHLACWPGNRRNTLDITRFLALEGRSFVVSASGLLHRDSIPAGLPGAQAMREAAPEWLADGGSAIAGPDGGWLVEPLSGREELLVAELDLERVFEERQNLDISGHYSRPDVFELRVDRRRQGLLTDRGGGGEQTRKR